MSISYDGTAIIGVRVDPKRLTTKGCRKTPPNHNFPADYTFDPKSGKPLWEDIDILADGVTVKYEGEAIDIAEPQVAGYDVVFCGWCESRLGQDGVIVLCSVNAKRDASIGSIDLPFDIFEKKEEMKKKLDPLGFWNSTFGLHLVMQSG